jgi:hypothetical protein
MSPWTEGTGGRVGPSGRLSLISELQPRSRDGHLIVVARWAAVGRRPPAGMQTAVGTCGMGIGPTLPLCALIARRGRSIRRARHRGVRTPLTLRCREMLRRPDPLFPAEGTHDTADRHLRVRLADSRAHSAAPRCDRLIPTGAVVAGPQTTTRPVPAPLRGRPDVEAHETAVRRSQSHLGTLRGRARTRVATRPRRRRRRPPTGTQIPIP